MARDVRYPDTHQQFLCVKSSSFFLVYKDTCLNYSLSYLAYHTQGIADFMDRPASGLTVTWCNGPLVSEMHWPVQEHLAWVVPVLFDLMQLHLSVNSFSAWFSELVVRAQAVSRPSLFPQCSKWDEAAVCHVCGGLSVWQGVRHSFSSPAFGQQLPIHAVLPFCFPSLLLCPQPPAPSLPLPSEICFLIKSRVNGCSSGNINEVF